MKLPLSLFLALSLTSLVMGGCAGGEGESYDSSAGAASTADPDAEITLESFAFHSKIKDIHAAMSKIDKSSLTKGGCDPKIATFTDGDDVVRKLVFAAPEGNVTIYYSADAKPVFVSLEDLEKAKTSVAYFDKGKTLFQIVRRQDKAARLPTNDEEIDSADAFEDPATWLADAKCAATNE